MLISTTKQPHSSSAWQTSLQAENHVFVPGFRSKLERSTTGILACVLVAMILTCVLRVAKAKLCNALVCNAVLFIDVSGQRLRIGKNDHSCD